jgi:hypothetical protein
MDGEIQRYREGERVTGLPSTATMIEVNRIEIY